MNFLEKNALFIKLKDQPASLEADSELLKQKNPTAPVLKNKYFDQQRTANEILYALVDEASEDEIIKNRQKARETAGKPSNGKGKTEGKKTRIEDQKKEKKPAAITGKTIVDPLAKTQRSDEGDGEKLPSEIGEKKNIEKQPSKAQKESEGSKKKKNILRLLGVS